MTAVNRRQDAVEKTTKMEAGGFLHPEQVIQQINFSPKQIVADFGCGAGYFTVLMAQAVGPDGQVFACDVQEPPLETVLSKAKTANVFNIKTIHCNLETPQSTKLAANSVDWIMLANILFQSQKKDTIIEEAKRILKPTGKIITVPRYRTTIINAKFSKFPYAYILKKISSKSITGDKNASN